MLLVLGVGCIGLILDLNLCSFFSFQKVYLDIQNMWSKPHNQTKQDYFARPQEEEEGNLRFPKGKDSSWI